MDVNTIETGNTKCKLLESYLNYLTVIKNRSKCTLIEYKTDLQMFFRFINENEGSPYDISEIGYSFVDIDFIKAITLDDMYAFIAYSKDVLRNNVGSRIRKIVSIRQFWRYLKIKARLLDNNVAEELETPKLGKRIPKYMSLDESVRLLMHAEKNARNYCIITLFLNCTLRLSELVSIDISQLDGNILTICGKGEKMRKVYITPSARKAINDWLAERSSYKPKDNALFITKKGTRIANRTIQNMVKKYLKQSGVTAQGISVHRLRHTAATLMYKYGKADIRSPQVILGHSDISTTAIYTHTSNDLLQATVNSNPLADMFNK